MLFFDVPGATVSRAWVLVSVAYSNVFRVRALSKDNQFRLSLGIGFIDENDIPVIVSRKTEYLQEAVWQEVRVPLRSEYSVENLSIFARISDVQWGSRGPVQFALQEGDKMIFDSASSRDLAKVDEVTGELHTSHGPSALVPAPGIVTIPANPQRKGGFIQNLFSNPVFVYFGPAVVGGFTDRQTARVVKGGRIEYPDGYLGPVNIDMKGQFSSDASLLSSVQYVGEAVV